MMYVVWASNQKSFYANSYFVGIATTLKRAKEIAKAEEHWNPWYETTIGRYYPDELTEAERCQLLAKHGKLSKEEWRKLLAHSEHLSVGETRELHDQIPSIQDFSLKQNEALDTKLSSLFGEKPKSKQTKKTKPPSSHWANPEQKAFGF